MQYLEMFELASERAEDGFILSFHPKMTMTCYADNVYPFKLFPQKQLRTLDFAPVTVLYGGNGSGKSTLLNVIAQKLELARSAPFNRTPFFEEYLELCDYRLTFGRRPPDGSRIITSDDVFDFLLDLRSLNDGVDRTREALFDEYMAARGTPYRFRSLDDYDELKRRNEAKRRTKSAFTRERLPQNVSGMSNGESAFAYFTNEIRENALYLLDEPENSLSLQLQLQLVDFLRDSVRFYHCQFVISTHSPLLLAMDGAKVYDLDARPVCARSWTELENVRIYHEFFLRHQNEFER